MPFYLHNKQAQRFCFVERYSDSRFLNSQRYTRIVFTCQEAIYNFVSSFGSLSELSFRWRELLGCVRNAPLHINLINDSEIIAMIVEMIMEKMLICYRQELVPLPHPGDMTTEEELKLDLAQRSPGNASAFKNLQANRPFKKEPRQGEISVEFIDTLGRQITNIPYTLYGPDGMAIESRSQQGNNIRHTRLEDGLYQITLSKPPLPWQYSGCTSENTTDNTISLDPGQSLWEISFSTGIPVSELLDFSKKQSILTERNDPNLLQAGDELTIPVKIMNHDARIGDHKTFRIQQHLLHIRIRLIENELPRSNIKCVLSVYDSAYTLTTDNNGRLYADNIQINHIHDINQVYLYIFSQTDNATPVEKYKLNVGSLNPLDGINGDLQRLWNCGYLPQNLRFPLEILRDFDQQEDQPDVKNSWGCFRRGNRPDINKPFEISDVPDKQDYEILEQATVTPETEIPPPDHNEPRTPDPGWKPPTNNSHAIDIFACHGSEITIHRRTRLRIDSHMHIQSNNCAPMPLQWRKMSVKNFRIGDLLKMSRKNTNAISPIFTKEMGSIGKRTTGEIGAIAIRDYQEAYSTKTIDKQNPMQDVINMMMVMTMDMEYGHLDGYLGEPIYQHEEFGWFRKIYHRALSITAPFNPFHSNTDGVHYHKHTQPRETKKIYLNREERKLFESWPVQLAHTKLAAMRYPLQLVPLYHYDPRRWIPGKSEAVQKQALGLSHPFDESISKNGIFVGYKMYTALGYRPLDERLPHLHDFYAFCEKHGRPITCHCTRGGMFTYDKEFYAEFLDAPVNSPGFPDDKNSSDGVKETLTEKEKTEQAIRWYNENFINPNAWWPVLDKYPNLYLCLAHFTGSSAKEYKDDDGWDVWIDNCRICSPQIWFNSHPESAIRQMVELIRDFPNVYVDISYMFVQKFEKPFRWLLDQYPFIKNRILYGSDWFMLENDISLTDFAASSREIFDSFGEALWERATHTNPLQFWRYPEWIDTYHKRLTDQHNTWLSGSQKLKTVLKNNTAKEPTETRNQIIESLNPKIIQCKELIKQTGII